MALVLVDLRCDGAVRGGCGGDEADVRAGGARSEDPQPVDDDVGVDDVDQSRSDQNNVLGHLCGIPGTESEDPDCTGPRSGCGVAR